MHMLQRQITEQEEVEEGEGEDDNVIQLYQMRRRWETRSEPLLICF